ncbi:hypothetical protein AYI70_g3520, partial [Smittium culicis]
MYVELNPMLRSAWSLYILFSSTCSPIS